VFAAVSYGAGYKASAVMTLIKMAVPAMDNNAMDNNAMDNNAMDNNAPAIFRYSVRPAPRSWARFLGRWSGVWFAHETFQKVSYATLG
jgi:hypothetical protein